MRAALITLLGTVALAGCENASAPAEHAAPAPVASIEQVQLTACPSPDEGRACEYDQVKVPEYFAQAMAGDYQAQRNLSYTFTGPAPWIVKRPVQGCAWRMVIMATRPADSKMDDAGMYKIQCGALSAEDQAAAREVAGLIHQRVHGSALPSLPPIPA